MRVLLITDLEGISGCVLGGYGKKLNSPRYEEYHSLMIGEINAVVEGCVQAKVEEIIVVESHPINLEKLHAEAKLARGVPLLELMKMRTFDALLFVGQHARTGLEKAVRSHTGSSNSIVGFSINEQPIGEIGYYGALLGSRGVPVLFLSGDTAACDEATSLIKGPVVTVAVEESNNAHGAICLPPSKTRPLLIEGVKAALSKSDEISPITFSSPVSFTIEFRYSKIADDFSFLPGVNRVAPRVISYTSEKYEDAFQTIMGALSNVLVKYDS